MKWSIGRSRRKKRIDLIEKWDGIANTYEEMGKEIALAEPMIPRQTLYRMLAGLYRLHADEIEEIYK